MVRTLPVTLSILLVAVWIPQSPASQQSSDSRCRACDHRNGAIGAIESGTTETSQSTKAICNHRFDCEEPCPCESNRKSTKPSFGFWYPNVAALFANAETEKKHPSACCDKYCSDENCATSTAVAGCCEVVRQMSKIQVTPAPAIRSCWQPNGHLQARQATADSRRRLAEELTNYLMSEKHDPQHVHDVLEKSLEITAQNAHLGAQSTDFKLQKMLSSQQANCAVLRRTLSTLCQRQNEMRRLITHTQASIHEISRSVQELRKNNLAKNSTPTPMTWHSSTSSHSNSVENDTISQLKNKIRTLETELRSMQSAPQPFHGVEHAWHSVPLTPLGSDVGPLEPVQDHPEVLEPYTPATQPSSNFDMIRSYYVGELLSPPFASSVSKLMHTIKQQIDPNSWDHAAMKVTGPGVSLVIAQSPENHDQIERLLTRLKNDTSWAIYPDIRFRLNEKSSKRNR